MTVKGWTTLADFQVDCGCFCTAEGVVGLCSTRGPGKPVAGAVSVPAGRLRTCRAVRRKYVGRRVRIQLQD